MPSYHSYQSSKCEVWPMRCTQAYWCRTQPHSKYFYLSGISHLFSIIASLKFTPNIIRQSCLEPSRYLHCKGILSISRQCLWSDPPLGHSLQFHSLALISYPQSFRRPPLFHFADCRSSGLTLRPRWLFAVQVCLCDRRIPYDLYSQGIVFCRQQESSSFTFVKYWAVRKHGVCHPKTHQHSHPHYLLELGFHQWHLDV